MPFDCMRKLQRSNSPSISFFKWVHNTPHACTPTASLQEEVLKDYGIEWDRVLLTTLGVANKRLYELRLQTATVSGLPMHACMPPPPMAHALHLLAARVVFCTYFSEPTSH